MNLPDDDEIEAQLAALRAERAGEMEGMGDDLAEIAANLESEVIAPLRDTSHSEQAALLAEAAALIRKAARSFKAGSAGH